MKLTHMIYLILFLAIASCQNNNKHVQQFDRLQKSHVAADSSFLNNDEDEILVYYFHATRRCATCQAVEIVTKQALLEYFGREIKFKSINNEIEANKELVEQYKISGQTLLVLKGDKRVDLTNEAFLNARKNPEILKAKIKETVESLI